MNRWFSAKVTVICIAVIYVYAALHGGL